MTSHVNPILERIISESEIGGAICLSRRHLTDEDMYIVVERALDEKQCSKLNLSQNQGISPAGISIITVALETNTTLHTFHLTNDIKFSNESAGLFAKALRANTYLQVLHLSHNGIGDDGAEKLAEALTENQTLRDLDLADNQIHSHGVQKIASTLQCSNRTLERLSLNYNPIGDGCVDSLVDMFQYNNTLKELDILRTVTLSAKVRTQISQAGQEKVR